MIARAAFTLVLLAGCSEMVPTQPNLHVDGWGRALVFSENVEVVSAHDGSYEAHVDGVATISYTESWTFDHQHGTDTAVLKGVVAGDSIVFGRDPSEQSRPTVLPDCVLDVAGEEPDVAAVDATIYDAGMTTTVWAGGAQFSGPATYVTCATLSWDELRPVIMNSTIEPRDPG